MKSQEMQLRSFATNSHVVPRITLLTQRTNSTHHRWYTGTVRRPFNISPLSPKLRFLNSTNRELTSIWGSGRAMTIALAQAGASIILVQRNLDDSETFDILNSLPAPAPSAPLQSSFKAEGKSSVVQGRKERTIDKIQCDLSDKSQVATLAERVLEQFGEVDILLNCGGINRRAKAELFTEEDWNEVRSPLFNHSTRD